MQEFLPFRGLLSVPKCPPVPLEYPVSGDGVELKPDPDLRRLPRRVPIRESAHPGQVHAPEKTAGESHPEIRLVKQVQLLLGCGNARPVLSVFREGILRGRAVLIPFAPDLKREAVAPGAFQRGVHPVDVAEDFGRGIQERDAAEEFDFDLFNLFVRLIPDQRLRDGELRPEPGFLPLFGELHLLVVVFAGRGFLEHVEVSGHLKNAREREPVVGVIFGNQRNGLLHLPHAEDDGFVFVRDVLCEDRAGHPAVLELRRVQARGALVALLRVNGHEDLFPESVIFEKALFVGFDLDVFPGGEERRGIGRNRVEQNRDRHVRRGLVILIQDPAVKVDAGETPRKELRL